MKFSKILSAITVAGLLMIAGCGGSGITTNNPGPGHPLQQSSHYLDSREGDGSTTRTLPPIDLSGISEWQAILNWSCQNQATNQAYVTAIDATTHIPFLSFGQRTTSPKIGVTSSTKHAAGPKSEQVYFSVAIDPDCHWTIDVNQIIYG